MDGSTIRGMWLVCSLASGAAIALVVDKGWRAVGVQRAAILFIAQFVLNLSWSLLLFRWHMVGMAMLLILVLWLLTGWTAAAFWGARDVAGAALLPFWAWVTFAVAIDAAIWRMN